MIVISTWKVNSACWIFVFDGVNIGFHDFRIVRMVFHESEVDSTTRWLAVSGATIWGISVLDSTDSEISDIGCCVLIRASLRCPTSRGPILVGLQAGLRIVKYHNFGDVTRDRVFHNHGGNCF